MTGIVLHFDAVPDADLSQIAAALQKQAAALPQVTEAMAEPGQTRSVIPEIILDLQVAATLFGTGATALVAFGQFIDAFEAVAKKLGLSKPRVEVGLEQVDAKALTLEHVAELRAG